MPADGTYRAIVSTPARTQLRYELWVVDATSTAGCVPITPDAFGTVPAHRAQFTARNLAVCYAFTAPAGAAYYVEAASLTSELVLVRAELRTAGAARLCSQRVCTVDAAGSQLLIVSRAVVVTTRVGEALAGLYRMDRLDPASSCPAVPTTFTAPSVAGAISAYAEVDCHRFRGSPGDAVAFNTTRSRFYEPVRHEIYDATGGYVCTAASWHGLRAVRARARTASCRTRRRSPPRRGTGSRSASLTAPDSRLPTTCRTAFGVAPAQRVRPRRPREHAVLPIERDRDRRLLVPRTVSATRGAGLAA